MYDGEVYVFGIGEYDGTNPSDAQTLQEVINNFSQVESVSNEDIDTIFS